jgi:hypothetical protein
LIRLYLNGIKISRRGAKARRKTGIQILFAFAPLREILLSVIVVAKGLAVEIEDFGGLGPSGAGESIGELIIGVDVPECPVFPRFGKFFRLFGEVGSGDEGAGSGVIGTPEIGEPFDVLTASKLTGYTGEARWDRGLVF